METKNMIIPATEAKEKYEAPVIEIIEVKVEQGVQMSPPSPGGSSGGSSW